MFTRLLFLLTVTLLGMALIGTTWPGPIAKPQENQDSGSAAEPAQSAESLTASDIDGVALLEKALAGLSAPESSWLRTKILQSVCDGDTKYCAEGFLQRGPNQCARLEMTLINRGDSSQLVVVSDGEILAEAMNIAQDKPKVVVERLPPTGSELRESVLVRKGCGGPVATLRQVRDHLKNVRVHSGSLAEQPIQCIEGELSNVEGTCWAATATPICRCRVFLHAESLWPVRIEWQGNDKEGTRRTVLQIEYLDPQRGRELGQEECEKLFSYRAD